MLKDLIEWLNQRNDGKYIVHSGERGLSSFIVRGPFTEGQYLKEREDLSYDDFIIQKMKENQVSKKLPKTWLRSPLTDGT